MKNIAAYAILVFASMIAASANAQDIVIQDADSIWRVSPQEPEDVKPIETRVIVNYANSIYHNSLNAFPDQLSAAVLQVESKFTINDANTTYWRTLIPPDPTIADFTARASGTSIGLTWTNKRASEFSGTMIVYSKNPISWRPIDDTSYQTGKVADPDATIYYIGEESYVTTPLMIYGLAPKTLYFFAAFAYNNFREYSFGSYIYVYTEPANLADVWPGDTDNNGLVDERDVLPIGMYWAKIGPPRVAASAEWKPQPAQVWSPLMVTYADANGDGVVDERDVLPIGINWNKTHEVPQGAPSIDLASIDHSRNLNAYLAIIAGLGDLPNDEAAAKIREFLQDIISLSESETIPKEDRLLSNYPNPFNPETWIPFELCSDSKVTIEIHDVSGRLIRKLDLGNLQAGVYRSKQLAAYWNGKTETGEMAASGVYFYTIRANGFSAVRKMILIK